MNKRSVIAVEADVETGQEVFAVCQELGLNVRVFRDALDALMQAAKSKPALMVFDADTPVLRSLDFADVVSGDPQLESVALIAIVGEADAVARRRYASRGMGVAAKRNDGGKTLRCDLLRLLRPFAGHDPLAASSARRAARTRGAA